MDFTVDLVRGGVVESRHRVSCCVVRADGATLASAGDPDAVTFWRSAAKPFQALPLVSDGGADALGIVPEELALACASHNGEDRHVALAHALLGRSGATVEQLACGPHTSLSDQVAADMRRRGERPTRAHSNCSGKHAGMMALGHHRGWSYDGYHLPEHPVQRRCLEEVARWAGLREEEVPFGTDGCGVPSFALPVRRMALAYARFGAAARGEGVADLPDAALAAAGRVLAAIRAHPFVIAGSGRLDTELLEASEGRVFAKVGAEGVYSATIPELAIGLALKVEDGAWRALAPALLGLLDVVVPGIAPGLEHDRHPPVVNTRGETVGEVMVRVRLRHEA
jgi:L-asparaginase II